MAHDTNLFDSESCAELYLDLFRKSDISYNELEIHNIHEFEEMYFRTDHHWNHVGAYQGYVDIIELLFDGKEKPNIPISKKCFDNVEFYGSHSRKVAYSVEMEGDIICKYIFELPKYELYIDGEYVSEYGNYSKYINDKIDTSVGFDHYNYLYQGRRAEIIFDTGKNDKNNILIISDSMSNPIRDTIASHFNKSIFINLDMYNRDIGEFNIEQYIKKFNVDKVLIMVVLGNYFPEGELKYLK